MPERGAAIQRAQTSTGLRVVEPEKLFEQMQQTFDVIARRAFEIFDTGGRIYGRDLENWFRAESEFVHPIHIEMAETDEELTVRAEVPGFTANELEVSVQPRQLTISGKREKEEEKKGKKTIYRERCSDQILRVIDLPTEVDRERVNATLNNGVLELVLQKAAPAKKVAVKSA
jgi:HSP20 family protein